MHAKLFIDDDRFPVDNTWLICRHMKDVQHFFKYNKTCKHISFDHDLGKNKPTGKDIANWLVEQDLDGKIDLHPGFTFYVHSQNPIGERNIEALLNQYLMLKRS